jgi:Kef-type K+ transport system membrane component KefB
MEKLSHTEVINLLMQLGIMILFARLFGELARRFKQPMVLGEIIAGVILGPSIFGMINPELQATFFPDSGASSIVLDGFITISVVLLLFIAGMEVELDLVWQVGRQALYTSIMSMIIPFAVGFLIFYTWPYLLGLENSGQRLVLALFIGTVLSITALPVIARILMDLGIFKSRLGMVIIASAMIVDILGWIIFSVILNMMEQGSGTMTAGLTIIVTLAFTLLMLTVGKALINRSLPWINRRFAWPGGVLSISIVFCFMAAAFTEYIGIHAIFGAFIFGVALSDSQHMSERAKEIVHQFINNIFGPLFFVSIGLYVNFIANFDLLLVVVVIILAVSSKLVGAYLGARIGGMERPESLAVGFGMNTHGALEVILGTIALTSGLISESLFVAILAMVIFSILVSPPLMKYSLQIRKKSLERKP